MHMILFLFFYQQARKSLKLFPLPLYSGKDCKVLAHFGDKICQLIDQRLEEYQEENGPVNWDEFHQVYFMIIFFLLESI